MKQFFCHILEEILKFAGYETNRERWLAQDLANVKRDLDSVRTELKRVNNQFGELKETADERLTLIDKTTALADERAALLQAESARREKATEQAKAAEKIRAEADRQREVIIADAQKDAEIKRGEGDADAAEIYARAYSKNKEFFQFNRSLVAYRQAFRDDRSRMVLTPDSEFFQYFKESQ